jgi:hypothetical protein
MPRYSAVFVNGRTKKIWTKSFRSKDSLTKAVMGITMKTNNKVKCKSGWCKPYSRSEKLNMVVMKSKGFKFKKEMKTHNSTKYRF